jgi:CRP/FNR family transcriptional regulator
MDRPRPQANSFQFRTATGIVWNGFSPSEIALLDQMRRRRVYQHGEIIFDQSDKSQGIYCVEDGHVLLSSIDAAGNKTAFGVISPSELMGYRSFFAEEGHAATASALTECWVYLIPRLIMHQLLDSNPALIRWFLRELASDRGPPNALLLRGQHMSIRERVANLLLILRDNFAITDAQGGLVFQLPIRRQEMAALVGVRPETLSRVIRDLEQEGLATFDGRRIVVPQPDQLMRISEPGAFS